MYALSAWNTNNCQITCLLNSNIYKSSWFSIKLITPGGNSQHCITGLVGRPAVCNCLLFYLPLNLSNRHF